MNKKKPDPKTIKYNGGLIRTTKYGTFGVEINANGTRILRTTVKTMERAKTTIDTEMVAIESNTRPLTTLETEEARRVFAILPEGVTLSEVAKFYLDRKATVQQTVTVSAATEKYLDSQAKRGLRSRSMSAERGYINRLAKAFPNQLVTDLTVDDLATALEDMGVTGVTYNNYRRYWSIFGDWCIKRNYAVENPAKRIEDHLIEDEIAEFYPVAEAKRWFAHLEEIAPDLLRYMFLHYFAGIRASELHRMTGDMVTPELIKVTPKASKTRSQRHITPEPNLRAWIEAYPASPGRLTTEYHFHRVREVRRALPGFNWVHNGGRKSCATYMLELTQDAPRTATVLGHKSTQLLFETYRGLTTQADAQAYFNILPGASS